ncbi:hypothetical protein yaldo0001_37010 [Yersinia aldovae ATCC 35236]|nr:hypothetical protein yaldo0001_37010 [Yersinia aldovae ATCC 35236]
MPFLSQQSVLFAGKSTIRCQIVRFIRYFGNDPDYDPISS